MRAGHDPDANEEHRRRRAGGASVTDHSLVPYEPQPGPTEVRRSARLSRTQLTIVIAAMVVTAALAGALAATSPPTYETQRSVIVLSGANPNDNEVITRALESIIESKGLAAEVKRRGELPQSIDAISAMISASRSPESAYMDVIAASPDREVSEAVSAQIIPALTSVFETAQRDLPVENRIAGTMFQEVFPQPSRAPRGSRCGSPSPSGCCSVGWSRSSSS
jgi:hypothetical protein